jgi:hypothetical protein
MVRSVAKPVSPPNVDSSSKTTSASSVSSDQPKVKQAKEEVKQAASAQEKPVSEKTKKERHRDKKMSAAMRKASFDHSMQTKGTGPAAAAKSTPTADAVGKTAATAAVSQTGTGPMQQVKVNVLTHSPSAKALQTLPDSIKDRLAYFDSMCAKASAGIPKTSTASGEKQMNVMVAPEWLFARHSGKKDEAYTATEMQKITEGLQDISKKYPDMLIVGGSVSWEIPDKNVKDRFIMYNSSPVVQNGKVVHMYHKREEGGETAVSPQNKGVVSKAWGMYDPSIRSKVEHSNPKLPSNSSIFTHQGVTFSMEICADQAGKSARKEYMSQFPGGKGTDVHVLISAGSQLNAGNTPVKNGGLVVHVDASGPGSAKAGTVTRPDLSISDWVDTLGTEKLVTPTVAFANPGSVGDQDGVDDSERIRLFPGLSVSVPKKD